MKKRQLASFALLIASTTLVVSITTTAAWFIGISQLGVGCMDVKIGTKNVEIKTEDGEFKTELSKSDLDQVDYFIPCTSAFKSTWMSEHGQMPVFRSSYTECSGMNMTNPDFAPVATKGYFAQDLYIRTSGHSYILVDPVNTKIEPDYIRNAEKAAQLAPGSKYSQAEIEQQLNSIVRSLRIGILALGYYNSDDTPDNSIRYDYQFAVFDCYKFHNYGELTQTEDLTYFGGIMDVDGDGFFDAASDREVLYGEVNDYEKAVFDEPTGQPSDFTGEQSCFNARHNETVKTFNFEDSIANGLEIAEEGAIGIEEADKKFSMEMFSGKQRKFVLCFYIEGWDRENTNLTMYAAFKLQINFMAQDGINN